MERFCEHEPDFYGEDQRGVCSKCGAECDWHWEDTGVKACVENYEFPDPVRVIDEWYEPESLAE